MSCPRSSLSLLILFLLLSLALPAGAQKGAGRRAALPRGLWLEELRDASILWGGEYYVLLRAGYFARHIPVEGFSVSDRETTARGRLFLSYGLLRGRIDLSASIDAYGRWFSPRGAPGRESLSSSSSGDIGDSRLGLRFALPSPLRRLCVSLEGFVTLPTGSQEKSFSSHSTDGGSLLAFSWRQAGFRAHLQSGYRLNRNESDGVHLYPLFYPDVPEGKDNTTNDALLLRAGVEFSTPGVDLYAELFADQLLWGRDRIRFRENSLQLVPGLRIRLRRGWYLSGSLGISLSQDDPETEPLEPLEQRAETLFPDWTVSVGLHVTGTIGGEDRDDDGVEDPFDLCPNAPEDYDGYLDDDGCPDMDNDRDGVIDDWDKAPYDPEDWDGFEDEDGAPDYDNDEDGIPDVEDFCPDEPEDFDGDKDEDGCPDRVVDGGGEEGS